MPDFGDGRCGHDRRLQVAVTGNVRISGSPEYICAPSVGGPHEVRVSGPSLPASRSESAVKGGPTGPSEAAPLTAEERRLWPAVDRLFSVSERGRPREQQATTKSAELRAFRA
jgi:hypothetical protein